MIRNEPTVCCDECDRRGPSGTSSWDAESRAIHARWAVRKVHYTGIVIHLCPACAARPEVAGRPEYQEVIG